MHSLSRSGTGSIGRPTGEAIPCIGSWSSADRNRNLKPGGWIEHIDASVYVDSDDNTVDPESTMGRWFA